MHPLTDTSKYDSSPAFCFGKKVNETQMTLLWGLVSKDPECPSRIILMRIVEYHREEITVSIRQINRLREKWKLNRAKGRPCNPNPGTVTDSDSQAEPVRIIPNLPYAGLHVFNDWMDQKDGFSEVLMLLKKAIEVYRREHGEESFPLLYHKDKTLELHFKALFYGPLLGIGKLTEFDIKEHPLETLIGRSYQGSTLNQFLGQLERADVGPALMPALLPAVPKELCYIDGHMIAFWTKASMHKGKITMLGRIMPGSQAVVAHNEEGYGIFVEYYPPDIRLPHIILNYCGKIKSASGIEIFVIDREVNSVKMASDFHGKGLGLLSMLDKNEYKDLSDWDTSCEGELEDGSKVYSGQWKKPRKGDPREFVIVERDDRLLVYWGTPRVKEAADYCDWPVLYSQRTEIQENSFKRMIGHGALKTNYGNKKITGQDRHQQRAVKKVEETLAAIHSKKEKKEEQIKLQYEKVKESEHKGHCKRLEQRLQNLDAAEKELEKTGKKEQEKRSEIESLGPPKERSDRDFRKQLIMTFRTLLLENALITFFMGLPNKSDIKEGLDTFIEIFLRRGGTYLETHSQIVYQINTSGLSTGYKETLEKIAQGLNLMNLSRCEKPIQIRLKQALA